MKAVALLAPYLRRADAVGLQLIAWARALRKQGYDLRLFVEHIAPNAPPDVVALTHVVSRDTLPGSSHWRYLAAADVVVCDYPAYYGLADCVRLLSGPRIVFSYHGVTSPEVWPDAEGRKFLERSRRRVSLAHFADVALARSQFTRRELHALTGYPLERIHVVPYLVPAPDATRPAREPGRAPLILSVGRLAANKRPWMLVEALALVRRALPGARLVLAGDARGPSHAPVLAEVRDRAVALGLSDAVHCVGLVDELLEHFWAQADLFAIASMHEGFCIPVVEAMARGVPVVATAGGALPETVGDAGLLADLDDVPGLAAALIDALSNPEQRERMITRGYERARRYRPDVVAAELLRVLDPTALARSAVAPLPRLSQLVDLHAVHLAAEVAPPAAPAPRSVPLISPLARRLRAWLTSDIRRQLDLLNQQQVAYNRRLAEVLDALDELSATMGEQQAATRRREVD